MDLRLKTPTGNLNGKTWSAMSVHVNLSEIYHLLPPSARAKLIPRIFGGLGNQLFCYAAARRLALMNHAELVLDDVTGFEYDEIYKRHYQLDHFNITCRKATRVERLEPFSRVRRFLKRKWNQRLPFAQRTFITMDGINFDSRLLHFKPQGTVYLEGYWQSEDYFKDVADTLREELRIKPPRDAMNLAMATDLIRRSHIQRTQWFQKVKKLLVVPK